MTTASISFVRCPRCGGWWVVPSSVLAGAWWCRDCLRWFCPE